MQAHANPDDDCLQEIEQFISEHYPHDPKYLPSTTSSCQTGFKSPPGQRKRILMFVEETKKSVARSQG